MRSSAIVVSVLAALVVSLALPSQLPAQEWSAEQQEVWSVIVESWDAIVAKDIDWTDTYVHPNAVVWGDDVPMPRNRSSVKKWERYSFQNSTTLVSEYSLAAMVVQSNTAVAHYYYSLGTEDAEGKPKTVHGRCTDILIIEDGRWLFLAWRCGDMPSTSGT
ncbi:MAG: nuclear transport factor 2 family protein [Acidobacteriota bacterium]|nr:MAG: nuclear transport factor 2 family protein [Acidobacteriota bacterium]